MKFTWFVQGCLCISAINAFATGTAPRHMDLSRDQIKAIQTYSQQLNQFRALDFKKAPPASIPLRPVSEVETAGYFFMSADTDFDSAEAKRVMIKNLPSDVTAVIFANPGSNKNAIANEYNGLIAKDRLKVISLNDASSGFWARDGLPIAVWSAEDSKKIKMVDAKYYHHFEPDRQIAEMFQAPLIKNSYYYEGGNFMVNDLGDCLTVDNDLSTDMPLEIFKDDYGCKNTIRLPFEKGIGHADESVRFIRSKLIVTDSQNYADILKAKGFEVQMLPRPENEYETYVNALLVNDTIYVPIFNETSDEVALKVYRSFGLKVVPIVTSSLSNDGLGSLHCITMTYPPVPFQTLLEMLHAN